VVVDADTGEMPLGILVVLLRQRLHSGTLDGLEQLTPAQPQTTHLAVKLKYADFQQVTRSLSGAAPVATQVALEQVSLDLLRPLFPPRLGVRLVGVTLSNLDAGPGQDAAQLVLAL